MPQGKMKVKGELPTGAKIKKNKGRAVTKRSNAPVRRKPVAGDRGHVRATVSKLVNAAVEQQLRARATDKPVLSAAQQRVIATAPAPVTTHSAEHSQV